MSNLRPDGREERHEVPQGDRSTMSMSFNFTSPASRSPEPAPAPLQEVWRTYWKSEKFRVLEMEKEDEKFHFTFELGYLACRRLEHPRQ